MKRLTNVMIPGLATVGVLLLAAGLPVLAAEDAALCELRLRGHSIVELALTERAKLSQFRFENPGETVRLPAGHYRVQHVELQDGYVMIPWHSRLEGWFEVSREGPNELIVGAPLYSTATGNRHGAFLRLDYDVVDGAGRSYLQQTSLVDVQPPPPRFEVFKDGEPIGSGSFEYG